MSYMAQCKDYYDDQCIECAVLSPYCQPSACCEYVPPPCYYPTYPNCCGIPRECRSICRPPPCPPPSCCPRRVCIRKPVNYCVPPCEGFCQPACYSPPCCQYCCPKEETNCCDKYEDFKRCIIGFIVLIAFVGLIFVVNYRLMSPCKRRFFI